MKNENNHKDKIILIGGVPCIGKSTVAEKLSREFNTNLISTDTIRSLLRVSSEEDNYRSLHFFVHQEAGKYLPNTNINGIIKDYIKESEAVWVGIKRIIKKNKYNKIGIIEGVANLPILCKKSRIKNTLPIFLYFDREDIIRNNLFDRGLWGKSKKLKEYELKYLIEFNKYIVKTSQKYNYNCINVYPYRTLHKRLADIIKNERSNR
ncbi:MAG: hypothetical protein U9P70_01390 [Patescibacteria group bacterium]|nr:hypothetical protein [Patescibacteria group bacterium]